MSVTVACPQPLLSLFSQISASPVCILSFCLFLPLVQSTLTLPPNPPHPAMARTSCCDLLLHPACPRGLFGGVFLQPHLNGSSPSCTFCGSLAWPPDPGNNGNGRRVSGSVTMRVCLVPKEFLLPSSPLSHMLLFNGYHCFKSVLFPFFERETETQRN